MDFINEIKLKFNELIKKKDIIINKNISKSTIDLITNIMINKYNYKKIIHKIDIFKYSKGDKLIIIVDDNIDIINDIIKNVENDIKVIIIIVSNNDYTKSINLKYEYNDILIEKDIKTNLNKDIIMIYNYNINNSNFDIIDMIFKILYYELEIDWIDFLKYIKLELKNININYNIKLLTNNKNILYNMIDI